jgi:hypothetical protein
VGCDHVDVELSDSLEVHLEIASRSPFFFPHPSARHSSGGNTEYITAAQIAGQNPEKKSGVVSPPWLAYFNCLCSLLKRASAVANGIDLNPFLWTR